MKADKDKTLLEFEKAQFKPLERAIIRMIRQSFDHEGAHQSIQWLQRNVGARWIEAALSNVRKMHHMDRLPEFDRKKSYICVCNHRSFFDLYVVTAALVAGGMRHRILFPVRSHFFYDHPLGPIVNWAMSFFAMYPPIFRDRKRVALNLASLNETVELLNRGGTFLGVHPEGARKLDGDPYTFLPPQSGVGRVIYRSDAVVIPVFVNGLINDIVEQIGGNFTGKAGTVNVVFGKPIDFSAMRTLPESPRVHRDIAAESLRVIAELGQEEREIRAKSA